jgi:hypothetical protein
MVRFGLSHHDISVAQRSKKERKEYVCRQTLKRISTVSTFISKSLQNLPFSMAEIDDNKRRVIDGSVDYFEHVVAMLPDDEWLMVAPIDKKMAEQYRRKHGSHTSLKKLVQCKSQFDHARTGIPVATETLQCAIGKWGCLDVITTTPYVGNVKVKEAVHALRLDALIQMRQQPACPWNVEQIIEWLRHIIQVRFCINRSKNWIKTPALVSLH